MYCIFKSVKNFQIRDFLNMLNIYCRIYTLLHWRNYIFIHTSTTIFRNNELCICDLMIFFVSFRKYFYFCTVKYQILTAS